jgi:hypothetical protein
MTNRGKIPWIIKETAWPTCEDSRKLLEWVRPFASDRKLRLFACAFWRWWYEIEGTAAANGESDPEKARALDLAELWAEHGVWSVQKSTPFLDIKYRWHPVFATKAYRAASWTIRETVGRKHSLANYTDGAKYATEAEERQVVLLRDLFGNPFQPMGVDPTWQTPAVIGMARSIYEGRNFVALTHLADTLQEAGCIEEAILSHCRADGKHVRGCWVVDLLLMKH